VERVLSPVLLKSRVRRAEAYRALLASLQQSSTRFTVSISISIPGGRFVGVPLPVVLVVLVVVVVVMMLDSATCSNSWRRRIKSFWACSGAVTSVEDWVIGLDRWEEDEEG